MANMYVPPRCPHCGERFHADKIDAHKQTCSVMSASLERILDQADRAMTSAALDNLGRQLTIAAGLTRAFRAGFDAGFGVTGEGFNGEYAPRLTADGYARMLDEVSTWSGDWRPGCGKEAP